jgi:dsRNA-specific ribonuclease
LARALVDPSADEHPRFNNSSLAFLGGSLINYHTAEWLMCRYPRLPMGVLYSAMEGYAAQKPLHSVARSWGVESAAAPGEEVDPGLLQFAMHTPHVGFTRFGYERVEAAYLEKFKWRRGMSSRIVLDDDFGNQVDSYKKESNRLDEVEEDYDPNQTKWPTEEHRGAAIRAHGNFVRAVVGAIYAHCGRESAKAFIKAHILSRTLDLSRLFKFLTPVRELALLCHREGFEAPVARLLSETGRLSRTPVFVVGIYSGKDKLGEGASYSLDAARAKAAVNGLKAWYLYSPGQTIRVPSDMLVDGAKPWEAAHIDPGEVV